MTLRATFPKIDGLNPLFLDQHGIVLIGANDGRLTIGMSDCGDVEVIKALQFATGMKIVAEPLPRADEDEGPRGDCGPGPSLLDQVLLRLGLGPGERPIRPDIQLGDDHARGLQEGFPDRVLAYDDAAAWSAFKSDLGERSRLVVMALSASTLKLTLPAYPRNKRQLYEMLRLSAPLARRKYVCTDPVPGNANTASVTLIRRDWLDPRVVTIRQQVPRTELLVVDPDLNPFHQDRFQTNQRLGRIGSAFTIAVALSAAAWSWQAARLPSPTKNTDPAVSARGTAAARTLAPAPAPTQTAATPILAPQENSDLVLLGIAGRLPDDADVLVKTPWGRTATMRIGDTLLGWTLMSISADRIILEKGGARDELVLEPPT